MGKKTGVTGLLIVLVLLSVLSGPCRARVTGICVNCHTMHNSQDNLTVTDSGSPNQALLISDCIGCHTGQNTGSNAEPYVHDTSQPLYSTTGTEADSNTLAGGSFYWVSSGLDRMGHNVDGLATIDATLGNTPPGSSTGAMTLQLRCAGTYGCHGNLGEVEQIPALKGGHHNKDHLSWQDGSTLAKSYRFLDTIQGFGDSLYEYKPTENRHNKYYGVDRSAESDQAPGSISALCARCHKYFHNGTDSVAPGATFGTGVWLRHPTDFDMSNAISSNEYQSYNGGSGTGNPYSVISPVATADVSTTLNTTVYTRAGDAVVMCLSCHRAHGSPYTSSLRWDYRGWPAGGYNGCAVCHTSKN